MKQFDDVIAKRTCDRRTLNVEPVALGIKPGYENAQIRVAQYYTTYTQSLALVLSLPWCT